MSNSRKENKQGTINIAQKMGEDGSRGIPLSAAEETDTTRAGLSITLGCSPEGGFRGSRLASIPRISRLCFSTFSLSYLMSGVFGPLPRDRSVSHRNLQFIDMVSEQVWG